MAFNKRRDAVLHVPTRRHFRAQFPDANPLKMPARAGVTESYEWRGYDVLVDYQYVRPPYAARAASALHRGSTPRDDEDRVTSLRIQPFQQ